MVPPYLALSLKYQTPMPKFHLTRVEEFIERNGEDLLFSEKELLLSINKAGEHVRTRLASLREAKEFGEPAAGHTALANTQHSSFNASTHYVSAPFRQQLTAFAQAQGNTCAYCSQKIETGAFDQVVPIALGHTSGLSVQQRLAYRRALFETRWGVVICGQCNAAKSAWEVAASNAWRWLRSGQRPFTRASGLVGSGAAPLQRLVHPYDGSTKPSMRMKLRVEAEVFLRNVLPNLTLATYFDAPLRCSQWHLYYDSLARALRIAGPGQTNAGTFLGIAQAAETQALAQVL